MCVLQYGISDVVVIVVMCYYIHRETMYLRIRQIVVLNVIVHADDAVIDNRVWLLSYFWNQSQSRAYQVVL